MKKLKITIPLAAGDSVSAVLTTPQNKRREKPVGVITAHGAGNDMENPLLADYADGLARAGFPALRFNFLYKEKGLKAPDKPEMLEQTWVEAFRFFRESSGVKLNFTIGAGKSMGGRIASRMAAAGTLPVDGLIFLGYPLHPAGDLSRIRDAHLYKIDVPMLFFAGTRDSLCNLEKLQEVLHKLAAPWTLDVIEGGDHSFNVTKSMGIGQSEIHSHIVKVSVQWVENTFLKK